MEDIQCLLVTDAQWLLEDSVYIVVSGPVMLSSLEHHVQDIVIPATPSVLVSEL